MTNTSFILIKSLELEKTIPNTNLHGSSFRMNDCMVVDKVGKLGGQGIGGGGVVKERWNWLKGWWLKWCEVVGCSSCIRRRRKRRSECEKLIDSRHKSRMSNSSRKRLDGYGAVGGVKSDE